MLVIDAAPLAADSKSEGENPHVMLHTDLKQSTTLTERELCESQ